MTSKTILIPFQPVAQGRPRFGRGRVYDPPKSRAYKEYARLIVAQQWKGEPLKGPLIVSFFIYIKTPNNKTIPDHATTKPDLSNYIKGLEDALEGIVWKSDSLIVGYGEGTGKYYSSNPRVEIKVEEM